MITVKIALRNLFRRKSRMIAIGLLVYLGTLLIVLGDTFSISAKFAGKASIVENFTGDVVLYSSRSKEKPTPFAFTTPLPLIENIDAVVSYLRLHPNVRAFVPYSQNYSLISIEENGQKSELPFIFYAVEPGPFASVFKNLNVETGSYFGKAVQDAGPEDEFEHGILLTRFQIDVFEKNYDTKIAAGDDITVLGLTEGGSVNAIKTKVLGVFEPIHYRNVFNYINLIDIETYSQLYNFTGVTSDSLPDSLNRAFSIENEDDIFSLANDSDFGKIDPDTLSEEQISGYTLVSVIFEDQTKQAQTLSEMSGALPQVLASPWDEASGGFAAVSAGIQVFIYVATFLIFLVVVLIFMNTLIINVMERTPEIGTMRAIGSEKSFVRAMFLFETFILNAVFAAAGIVTSIIVILLFSKNGVPLPETVSQYLIGGGNLPLRITVGPFVEAIVLVCAVSLIATIYPIRVATRITPLAAMSEK